MKKKGVCFTLACCLFIGIFVYVRTQALAFSDVSAEHWAADAIERAANEGFVQGTGDGSFAPERTLSAAEFSTMLCNLLYPQLSDANSAEAWWQPYMETVFAQGVLSGTTLAQARDTAGNWSQTAVEAPLSRYDMALMIANAAETAGWNLPNEATRTAAQGQIADWGNIPSAYQQAVRLCYAAGFITGTDSAGSFSGDMSMTRAQAALVLCRLSAAQTLESAQQETQADTQPLYDTQGQGSEATSAGESSFQITFLDVGQADAALIECDGETLLIDGGNAADSNLIYSVLTKKGITHLDYVICTHAHEDHVGGLSGALQAATAGVVYSPVTSYSSKAFKNFAAAVEAQGLSLTVPTAGDVFSVGSANVVILGPVKEYTDTNNTSIVVQILYGNTSYLFTGDMERAAELDLIDSGVDLKSDVLKVGHHGSSTSSSYVFLNEVLPDYAVISCGTNNSYGHPHEEVLSRLADAEVELYRTDLQGDITLTSDGEQIWFQAGK